MATKETNGKAESSNGEANGAPASKVPEWLQGDLFVDLLKKQFSDFKQITTFEAKPALAAGENYATMMLRIEIVAELQTGKQKTISFMMKVPIEGLKVFLDRHNIFEIERDMYQITVREFEQMYRDEGVEVHFGPKSFDLKTPNDFGVILLEDLRPKGFKNTNRLEGLDMIHTQAVLKKLAQWHAASATRVETKGIYSDTYVSGYFKEDHLALTKEMNAAVSKVFMQCAKHYDGHEKYFENLEKLEPKAIDLHFQTNKVDPNEFNVLNHGDCWSNNVMFQYDAFGKIKETYFVDYQIPKYGSPAQDLLYFLLSSTQLELKLKHFEYFIKYYYDNLIENLKLLKYPKKLPTLIGIHIALYKHGIWGYVAATGVMAAVLVDPHENANIDNFLKDTEAGHHFKLLMYSNQRYRKHIEVILPWLQNRGALEC